MIVTHRKIEQPVREENNVEKQELKSKIVEVDSQPSVCDENCIFAFSENAADETKDNEASEEKKTIRCTILGRDVDYKQCCIECPMIDKVTYDSQIIEKYNYDQSLQNTEEDIESVKVNAAMDAFKDVQAVVVKMLEDEVIDKNTADTLIWGALLECHNINKDLMPQNTVYQIYGIWASRQFRK